MVTISRLGLGCSNFGKRIDADTAVTVVQAALDCGITFFDVADVYGGGTAEQILARGLGGRRGEAFIATKFGNTGDGRYDGRPRTVIKSAEASLRALGTDYLDLYQMHGPDPSVPLADTLGALQTLIDEGKVLRVGCSNFTDVQLAEADVGTFFSATNEYSLLERAVEADVLPYCRANGIRFIPYFPLASGVLTGKYRKDARIPAGSRVAMMKPDKLFRFFTPRALDLVEELVEYGATRGRSVLELAIGFLLAEPTTLTVVTGAMSAEQVYANAAAAKAAETLTGEEIGYLRQE